MLLIEGISHLFKLEVSMDSSNGERESERDREREREKERERESPLIHPLHSPPPPWFLLPPLLISFSPPQPLLPHLPLHNSLTIPLSILFTPPHSSTALPTPPPHFLPPCPPSPRPNSPLFPSVSPDSPFDRIHVLTRAKIFWAKSNSDDSRCEGI